MAWETQKRRNELPTNWSSLRLSVLRRDRRTCQARFDGCVGTATEVDHIYRGNDHSEDNLRAICKPCHSFKSSIEGHEARARRRALKKRPPERHPGMN